MKELIKKISDKLHKRIKNKQFEIDYKAICFNIVETLNYYRKLKGKYYTEQEQKEIIKSLKSAEKNINGIFEKKSYSV